MSASDVKSRAEKRPREDIEQPLLDEDIQNQTRLTGLAITDHIQYGTEAEHYMHETTVSEADAFSITPGQVLYSFRTEDGNTTTQQDKTGDYLPEVTNCFWKSHKIDSARFVVQGISTGIYANVKMDTTRKQSHRKIGYAVKGKIRIDKWISEHSGKNGQHVFAVLPTTGDKTPLGAKVLPNQYKELQDKGLCKYLTPMFETSPEYTNSKKHLDSFIAKIEEKNKELKQAGGNEISCEDIKSFKDIVNVYAFPEALKAEKTRLDALIESALKITSGPVAQHKYFLQTFVNHFATKAFPHMLELYVALTYIAASWITQNATTPRARLDPLNSIMQLYDAFFSNRNSFWVGKLINNVEPGGVAWVIR